MTEPLHESNSSPGEKATSDRTEMEANYPYFKAAVYDWLREKAIREVPAIEDQNLEKLVKESGAQPLNEFIDELWRSGEIDDVRGPLPGVLVARHKGVVEVTGTSGPDGWPA